MDKEEKFKSKFFYGVGIGKTAIRFAPTTPTIKNFF